MLYLKCNKDKKESEKMKKINMNRKGFTLIELLAVITIMGILMMVAIPSVSRTIENSRRDTFADVAKSYVNTIRSSVLADEIECLLPGTTTKTSVGATPDGVYYYQIDTSTNGTKDLMESGGKSSWSNSDVGGYVVWNKKTGTTTSGDTKTRTTYAVLLVDTGKHGFDALTLESDLKRANVKTATATLSNNGDIKIKDYNAAKTAAPTIAQAKKIFGDTNVSTETTSTAPAACTLK